MLSRERSCVPCSSPSNLGVSRHPPWKRPDYNTPVNDPTKNKWVKIWNFLMEFFFTPTKKNGLGLKTPIWEIVHSQIGSSFSPRLKIKSALKAPPEVLICHLSSVIKVWKNGRNPTRKIRSLKSRNITFEDDVTLYTLTSFQCDFVINFFVSLLSTKNCSSK